MLEALREAEIGYEEGEVPIGAVAVRDGKIVAMGHNRRRALSDITAHAEMMCLRNLSHELDGFDLGEITIYSTLEPCAMCAGAMIHYGIGRVVYGARDLRLGADGSEYNFLDDAKIEVTGGVLDRECREILYKFFEKETGTASRTWQDIALE